MSSPRDELAAFLEYGSSRDADAAWLNKHGREVLALYDEVERLRSYEAQMDEILGREDIHDYWFTIGKSCTLGEAFSELLAENERLRQERDAYKAGCVDVSRQLRTRDVALSRAEAAEAEVARLREYREEAEKEIFFWQDKEADAALEVERLIEDNQALALEVGHNAVTVVGLQAEIERLREMLVQHHAVGDAPLVGDTCPICDRGETS